MAITNSDGSIILSTKVDTSGINQGMSQIKKSGKTAQSSFESLGSTLKNIAGYITVIFSAAQLIQFSKAAGEVATQTEASVQRLVDIYGAASDELGNFIDSNARMLGMSKSAAAEFASVYGNLFSVWADQNTNAQLTTEYLNMTAVVASKTGRTVTDVQERIRSGLLGNTEAVEDLGVFVNVKTIEMTDAFQRMANGKSWEQLDAYSQQQIRTMAILEQATDKYGNEVAKTSATSKMQFQAAYEDFQNSWGQVVNTVLIPILGVVTEIMNVATYGLNTIFNLSDKIMGNAEKNSASIKTSVKGQEQLKDAVNDTAKAVKKATAGFDDLQILTSGAADAASGMAVNTETSLEGAGGGLGGISGGSLTGNLSEVSTEIAGLLTIAGYVAITIGVILCCYGQIPAGIGFILFGMAGTTIGIATLSNKLPTEVKLVFGAIMAIVGTVLWIVGIILICTGAGIPLGIGLIISGLAVAGGGVALNWGFISEKVTMVFKALQESALARTGLFVIGMILTFTGVAMGFGIPLILAGIAGMGVASAASVDWDALPDKLKEIWNNIKEIWGKYIQPGIDNAIDFVIEMYNKHLKPLIEEIGIKFEELWTDYLQPLFEEDIPHFLDKLKETWDNVWGKALKPALIWLGDKLLWLREHALEPFYDFIIGKIVEDLSVKLDILFAVVKVGIKLFSSGAKDVIDRLTMVLDFINLVFETDWGDVWDSIGDKVKTVFNKIIGYAEKGINFIIEKVNSLLTSINEISDTIGAIVGIDGFSLPTFEKIKIPRLAQGAVIPANREFLAVLGDQKQGVNIETPLDTMIQAFNAALDGRGEAVREEHYYLSETELMSIMYRLVKGGERLNGNSLVNGGMI